jgi:flagellar motor switch protein FliG
MITGPRYFSFIEDAHIRRVAGFCVVRRDRPWITVVVASFLRGDLARELIASLPTEMQARIALEILNLRPVPQERVEALEADVKAFLEAA